MPKRGPDTDKVSRIRETLLKNPQGLWVREIARKSGLDKSTVSIYLSRHLGDQVEEVYPSGSGLIKIVRLKK